MAFVTIVIWDIRLVIQIICAVSGLYLIVLSCMDSFVMSAIQDMSWMISLIVLSRLLRKSKELNTIEGQKIRLFMIFVLYAYKMSIKFLK